MSIQNRIKEEAAQAEAFQRTKNQISKFCKQWRLKIDDGRRL
jgi:hypothetical protein